MSLIETLENRVKGAAVGVATVAALPIFGTVGAITATGVQVSRLAASANCGTTHDIHHSDCSLQNATAGWPNCTEVRKRG